MELKKYIQSTIGLIIPIINNITIKEYYDKELDFVYGVQEYHSSFRKMFKHIKRLIKQWQ